MYIFLSCCSICPQFGGYLSIAFDVLYRAWVPFRYLHPIQSSSSSSSSMTPACCTYIHSLLSRSCHQCNLLISSSLHSSPPLPPPLLSLSLSLSLWPNYAIGTWQIQRNWEIWPCVQWAIRSCTMREGQFPPAYPSIQGYTQTRLYGLPTATNGEVIGTNSFVVRKKCHVHTYKCLAKLSLVNALKTLTPNIE